MAIAAYADATTEEEIDPEFVEKMFRGCTATLSLVPVSILQQGNPDHNIPDKVKQRRFARLDPATPSPGARPMCGPIGSSLC